MIEGSLLKIASSKHLENSPARPKICPSSAVFSIPSKTNHAHCCHKKLVVDSWIEMSVIDH